MSEIKDLFNNLKSGIDNADSLQQLDVIGLDVMRFDINCPTAKGLNQTLLRAYFNKQTELLAIDDMLRNN